MPFVAGRDELAGGTWLGVNAHGVIVGLTNHWTEVPPNPDLATRGEIVRALLSARNLDDVVTRLEARDPTATNPFLLLAATREAGAFWTSSLERFAIHQIHEGAFALGNWTPSEDPGRRARALGDDLPALLERDGDASEAPIEALATRLAQHVGDRGPDHSVCVHTERGYGTVSSTIIALSSSGQDDRYLAAAGPPCTHGFDDYSDLLRSIRAGA